MNGNENFDELDRLIDDYAAAKLAYEQAQKAKTEAVAAENSAQKELWEAAKDYESHGYSIVSARCEELKSGT